MSVVTHATAQLLRVLPRAQIGRAVGRLAEWPWPPSIGKWVVSAYAQAYGVCLHEADSNGGYATFDAFFTRRLLAGVRPVDPGARTIVSPADGRIESVSRIDGDGVLLVKGRPYKVQELAGCASEAGRFEGGVGFVVYLSPRDYHRVHAPVSGTIGRIRSMPGDYFPVNAIGVQHFPSLFCRNRRVAIEIDADGGLGRVTVVMVVAMIVGRITTLGVDARDVPLGDHTFREAPRVERGDEIGVFHLGSTAVVLLQAKATQGWLAPEGPVRFGQPLARASSGTVEAGETP